MLLHDQLQGRAHDDSTLKLVHMQDTHVVMEHDKRLVRSLQKELKAAQSRCRTAEAAVADLLQGTQGQAGTAAKVIPACACRMVYLGRSLTVSTELERCRFEAVHMTCNAMQCMICAAPWQLTRLATEAKPQTLRIPPAHGFWAPAHRVQSCSSLCILPLWPSLPYEQWRKVHATTIRSRLWLSV